MSEQHRLGRGGAPWLGLTLGAAVGLLAVGLTATAGDVGGSAIVLHPAAATDAVPMEPRPLSEPANPVPSVADRQAMAAGVLAILHANISSGRLNYRFNPSGEGVVLGTAGLAFIASGSTLASGPYQRSLEAIFKRMQQIMDQNNFPLQPVWGCGQSLVFLAELHRSAPPNQRRPIQALMLAYSAKLVESQTDRGSWCHTFEDKPNQLGYRDLVATTVLALQGLGIAAREGVRVPEAVFTAGAEYLVQSSDVSSGQIGYSPNRGQKGMAGPGRTAGGLLAMMAIGRQSHPLVTSASRYLLSTFEGAPGRGGVTATLQGGHASAQMGLGWAAWWAGRTQQYAQFWQGQGAEIASRRQADGSFLAAPSDGRKGAAPSHEAGDFANAWHALILLGDSPYLQIDHYGASNLPLLHSIAVAQELAKSWPGGTAPASLGVLSALGEAASLPEPAAISNALRAIERDLRGVSDPALIGPIRRLFHLDATVTATMNSARNRMQVDFVAPAALADRLGEVAITVSDPRDPPAFRPQSRTLRLGTRGESRSELRISMPRGSEVPTEVVVAYRWTVAGMPLDEEQRIAVGTSD